MRCSFKLMDFQPINIQTSYIKKSSDQNPLLFEKNLKQSFQDIIFILKSVDN